MVGLSENFWLEEDRAMKALSPINELLSDRKTAVSNGRLRGV